MAKIISAGTADAPYKLSQSEVKQFTKNLFSGVYDDIERMIQVFDNSGIDTRHITVPFEWLAEPHDLSMRNQIFRENALELSKRAINECLLNAGADYCDINHIIFVTSTGLATPTIDAMLFNELNLNHHIKRTPIWGLGCCAAAAAVSRAMDYCKAYPQHNVMVVAVELCSLTFQKDDLSKSNIIAASLFSDGCAAAMIAGSESKYYSLKGAALSDSLSTIYDDSLDVMGWDIIRDGFKVIFSRDIPQIVRENVKPNIMDFLTRHGLDTGDITYYIAHPGGMKVIAAYEESLGLPEGSLNLSRKVLREHGNMSSPSVLYVLKEFFNHGFEQGKHGILSALGPGFSSELVLFKTE